MNHMIRTDGYLASDINACTIGEFTVETVQNSNRSDDTKLTYVTESGKRFEYIVRDGSQYEILELIEAIAEEHVR